MPGQRRTGTAPGTARPPWPPRHAPPVPKKPWNSLSRLDFAFLARQVIHNHRHDRRCGAVLLGDHRRRRTTMTMAITAAATTTRQQSAPRTPATATALPLASVLPV